MTVVDRFRAVLEQRNESSQQEYTPLHGDQDHLARVGQDENDLHDPTHPQTPFSRLEYVIFLFLGIAMLWAWNMYLAATPYFEHRFAGSEWTRTNFQSSIISVGTFTNLASMLTLAHLQATASYTKRIISALIINVVVFTLLAISTVWFTGMAEGLYLAWVLGSVFCTSVATGLLQNGAFALAAGSGQPAYIQAIMTGQAIAGVLPPVAQMVSVLAVPASKAGSVIQARVAAQGNTISAFIYFLTATAISSTTLLLTIPLVRRHIARIESKMNSSITTLELAEQASRKAVPLMTLLGKLRWLAAAVFICFATTMFFPGFTGQIESSQAREGRSRIFEKATFIPLAFLCWNIGDLMGRLTSPVLPSLLSHRPQLLLVSSIARLGFIPLYYLCNMGGSGALIGESSVWGDVFYLLVVQLGFGLTNGWIGSLCMMGSGRWVGEGEGEAAGGFMSLMLVGGLAVGSALTFGIGK